MKLRYPGCFIKLYTKIIENEKFRYKFSIPCSKTPWKGKTISDTTRISASVDSLFREDTKTIGISRVIFDKSVPRSLSLFKFLFLVQLYQMKYADILKWSLTLTGKKKSLCGSAAK